MPLPEIEFILSSSTPPHTFYLQYYEMSADNVVVWWGKKFCGLTANTHSLAPTNAGGELATVVFLFNVKIL